MTCEIQSHRSYIGNYDNPKKKRFLKTSKGKTNNFSYKNQGKQSPEVVKFWCQLCHSIWIYNLTFQIYKMANLRLPTYVFVKLFLALAFPIMTLNLTMTSTVPHTLDSPNLTTNASGPGQHLDLFYGLMTMLLSLMTMLLSLTSNPFPNHPPLIW